VQLLWNSLERLSTSEDVNAPSAKPVGTYQKSIGGHRYGDRPPEGRTNAMAQHTDLEAYRQKPAQGV